MPAASSGRGVSLTSAAAVQNKLSAALLPGQLELMRDIGTAVLLVVHARVNEVAAGAPPLRMDQYFQWVSLYRSTLRKVKDR